MAIFESTVFLRAHNYPAVARILEPQMVSLPPDTAQSFCSCNTVVLVLSVTAISNLKHLCRQFLKMFTDGIMIQNGNRFLERFSSQITHTEKRPVYCLVKKALIFFLKINNKVRNTQLCEALFGVFLLTPPLFFWLFLGRLGFVVFFVKNRKNEAYREQKLLTKTKLIKKPKQTPEQQADVLIIITASGQKAECQALLQI